MDRFLNSFDLDSGASLDPEVVSDILANDDRSASELLMLYFVCSTSDPEEHDFGDVPERIAEKISDLADDGDEDAMMAMVALDVLASDDPTEEATIVGVAMLQLVATRPILRDIIDNKMDYEAAAAPLMVIKMLADHLMLDVLDPEGMDDLDMDDIDFDELASQLGMSNFDDNFDGDLNDR